VYPPSDENRLDLTQANEKLLVFYDYAADHGCWVTVYDGKKPVTRLKAPFDRPSAAFDRRVFESLELLSPVGATAVDAWARRAHLFHERVRAPHLVAERLRLPRYAWFSHLSERTNASPDPMRIEVLADGKVKRPPKPSAPHVAVAQPKKKTKPKKRTVGKARKK
jgi:hypothetical protein